MDRRVLVLALASVSLAGIAQLGLTRSNARAQRGTLVVSNAKEKRLAWARQLQRLLRARAFGELEKIAETCRVTEAKWPNGDWKLRTYYEVGFDHPLLEGGEAEWQRHLVQLQAWTRLKRNSITAPVALAQALIGYAWSARGTRPASEVTAEEWQQFRDRLAAAYAVLEQAALKPHRCPGWYQAMQTLALAGGWNDERYHALLSEALRFHADYPAYYELAAHRLLPRWQGVPGDWERFAETVTDTLPEPLQSEIYARIVWYQSAHYRNVIEQAEVSWPRVRRGFDWMTRAHPESIELESACLVLAGQGRDADQTAASKKRLGNRRDISVLIPTDRVERDVERALIRS